MSDSERMSRSFYEALGEEGLAARTRPEWDARIMADLAEFLPPNQRILDVGCGYGRIAVPLALAGHQVSGLDLSEALIRAARSRATAAGAAIEFVVGSMADLPYPDDSFDRVLCLWSAFHELLVEPEQRRALHEMWRVLAPDGLCLIEGAPYEEAEAHRVHHDVVDGRPNPHFAHDSHTFEHLCRDTDIATFTVATRPWGGRPRRLLELRKTAVST